MTLYNDLAAVSSELFANTDFKQGEMFLLSRTPGNGPASNPGPAVEVPLAVNGVARGAKFKYISKSLAVASDTQVTFGPITPEPKVTDFFKIDGVTYKIMYVDRKPSAGVAVAFTLILRR